MQINHPQHSPYYPAHSSPSSPPVRYVMVRSPASPDRAYSMVPCYQYQMVPMYYMPVSYGYSDKPHPYYRPVSLVSTNSPGDYLSSDVDLATSWEYQQGSDWSPPEEFSPNNDLSLPYTDWERQEEISSQDLSPRASPSPFSAISVSELEAGLGSATLEPPNLQCVDDQEVLSESIFSENPTAFTYDRDLLMKFKHLKSASQVRQKLGQVESQCVQTLFSSTSTFDGCADVIIYKKAFSVPTLISVFEDMMHEYGLEAERMPWFVLRVMIYVKFKKGKTFDAVKIAIGKEVYDHFINQAHASLENNILDECRSALEDEENSLKVSGAYNEFAAFPVS